MSKNQVGIPSGTRDFGPVEMRIRNHIFDTIRETFEQFAYMPLETPAMENLSVLMGKYGQEGDKLLFKILNSGDFLSKTNAEDLEGGAKTLMPKISEKGLRYDLTVPFARYVVMNRGNLEFPFKRYQIQPVWRADRPQKGRYREFYQCDADMIGSDSLIAEAEIVLMINQVLNRLGIKDFTIKLNNRKILTALSELMGATGQEGALCVAIDKLDKIGWEKVCQELVSQSFSEKGIELLKQILSLQATNEEKLAFLHTHFQESEVGKTGINELTQVFQYLKDFDLGAHQVEIDFGLARGLSYYTGAIFEVKVHHVSIGSIVGGGRYDNLTGVFGLPGMSGVGFSFGVDRIYDVINELGLFDKQQAGYADVLFAHFDQQTPTYCLSLLAQVRQAGFRAEIYPHPTKLKKQLDYANKRNISFVVLAGQEEIEKGQLTLKNMRTGEQILVDKTALIGQLTK